MSTHNICFHQEIRKIICGYPLLSVAMPYCVDVKADLRLCWSHRSYCRFCYVLTHMYSLNIHHNLFITLLLGSIA